MPTFTVTLTIDGSVIDQAADDVSLGTLKPFVRGGIPSVTVAKRGTTFTAGVDPWDAKEVLLEIDDGSGNVTYFKGDTGMHVDHFDDAIGLIRQWTCHGLGKRAEYIPVTDENTHTDCIRFNLDGDSPDKILARQGRTVGQMVVDVLEMPTNRAALIAAGIGNYSSPTGGGALAHSTLSSGGVASVVVDSGGASYASAPTVILAGGGGAGATATASLTSGAVSGVSVTAAGTGYTSPPVVILSTLPAATLTDLDALFIIPVAETDIVGERILQALEDTVQASHPNHFMFIEPDTGTIRFLDPRTFTPMTLTLGTDPVDRPKITVDWSECYQRCIVRGDGLVQAFSLGVRPLPGSALADNGLAEDFGHDGLTNADAKTNYKVSDFNAPGQAPGRATATAAISGGAVTTITVAFQGYSYTSAPGVVISGGSGSGATATANLTADKVTSVTVTAGGTGYTTVPTVTIAPPGVGQSDVGMCTCPSTTQVTVTSSDATVSWPADHWDQSPGGRHGVIEVASDVITGVPQKYSARVVANTSLSPGGTSTLTLDDALPSTSYDHYTLFGQAGGASFVYRRYSVTIPEIAVAMTNYFPYPRPFKFADGTGATETSTPKGTVYHSIANNGNPPFQELGIGITVDPVAGTITTEKPTALAFSSNGTTLVPVDDFKAFIAVNTGALTIAWPADIAGVPQYEGTSNTLLSLTRTKTLTIRDWKDLSNLANMQLLAREHLDACSDIVYEGEITHKDLLLAVLLPGISLNIAGDDGAGAYSTGYEAMNAPIVAIELDFLDGADSGTHYETHLSFSTRRTPYSAAVFTRPGQVGQPYGLDSGVAMLGGQVATPGNPFMGTEGFGGMPGDIPPDPGSYMQSMGLAASPGEYMASQGLARSPGEFMENAGLATTPGQFLESQGMPTSPGQMFGGSMMAGAGFDAGDMGGDVAGAGEGIASTAPADRPSREGESSKRRPSPNLPPPSFPVDNPAANARRDEQEALQRSAAGEQTNKDEMRRQEQAPIQQAAIQQQDTRSAEQQDRQQQMIADQNARDEARQTQQGGVQDRAIAGQTAADEARQAQQAPIQQAAIDQQDQAASERQARQSEATDAAVGEQDAKQAARERQQQEFMGGTGE